MSFDSQRPLNGNGVNGHSNALPNGHVNTQDHTKEEMKALDEQLRKTAYDPAFHGDALIGDKIRPGAGTGDDLKRALAPANWESIATIVSELLRGKSPSLDSGAQIVASLANDSINRSKLIQDQVRVKYERMLHPPLTYLGDAFKYRTADGKFNSALNPHLGQAGAPYAKTVPSKTHPLGALPDAGDLFDRLMARDDKGPRKSESGLSSMLIYHATIIIHDIFRTNDKDKNISDTSSYLDLSPLYGFTDEMQRKVRDDKYKLGLLKPDTFAEDRLLRQPPGVCIYLVMYNRYHNYAATQLRRINENGKFSVPKMYDSAEISSAARQFALPEDRASVEGGFTKLLKQYDEAWKDWKTSNEDTWPEHERLKEKIDPMINRGLRPVAEKSIRAEREKELREKLKSELPKRMDKDDRDKLLAQRFEEEKKKIVVTDAEIDRRCPIVREGFRKGWEAAWDKLDNDLFNTARLITCGMYIQVSIHDYLRALMGFHNYNTNFTLDPRIDIKEKEVSRGIGNQVTVEFNLLYRFHCAISGKDEEYAEDFIREAFGRVDDPTFDPKKLGLEEFLGLMAYASTADPEEPKDVEFGLKSVPKYNFKRDPVTKLFNDQQMIDALKESMDDDISNFGPRNIPQCLKPIEVLGILQARKWEIGTLNDFREFFGMERHKTFESMTPHKDVQNALRDLYEHPDKVELYPGVFCETNSANGALNADPGPSDLDSALWAAIFSDAITLVRSDRFYTVDWNTNSLTTWGMKEVTPDNDVCKSSVFHRIFQRAFPEWFPSDSIRFFHPFYTGKKNATLAMQQGYGQDFRILSEPTKYSWTGKPLEWKFDLNPSDPNRPKKPLLLEDATRIKAVLNEGSDNLVHPARLNLAGLPEPIQAVLSPGQKMKKVVKKSPEIDCNNVEMLDYFLTLGRDIVKREFITMDAKVPTYQIDVVKDFAIPIITRYVGDFLGFSHQIRNPGNMKAKYSENEIYQHITNCQVFLSYNADETKLLKRRAAFRDSMKFLFELTKQGHIREANKFPLTQLVDSVFGPRKNTMEKLGLRIAHEVIHNEGEFEKSAAILMLIGLDTAYNSVLAFTSVLDYFVKQLYDAAADMAKKGGDAVKGDEDGNKCDWQRIQDWAFDDDKDFRTFDDFRSSFSKIKTLCLEAQRKSVKLPIIRKATKDVPVPDPANPNGPALFTISKGQTVICDLNPERRRKAGDKNLPAEIRAEDTNMSGITLTMPPPPVKDEFDYIDYQSSFTEKFAHYHPKSLAALSLTAMIKVLAQMKDLRRGHDTQGKTKKINLDSAYEGYSNYMAPMRMREIEFEVKRRKEEAEKKGDKEEVERLSRLFNTKVLKPLTYTYLTPEWDEMVPFPTTWKVRFDGFGVSTYGGPTLPYLKPVRLPDSIPPWYQPTGPSRYGGSFATWDDAHEAKKAEQKCPVSHPGTRGCALPMKGY